MRMHSLLGRTNQGFFLVWGCCPCSPCCGVRTPGELGYRQLLAREGWRGYLTPWLFSWRRIGAILLGLVVLGYLLVQTIPTHEKDVHWGLYSLTQMLAPLFGVKALLWWGLDALKRVYVNKYIGEEKTTRVVDIYFMLWWMATGVMRSRQVRWMGSTLCWPCTVALLTAMAAGRPSKAS